MAADLPKILNIRTEESDRLCLADLQEFAVFLGLHQKREIEKKTALHIVQTVLKDPAIQILYYPNGKPYLQNGGKISVSHSHDKLVVLFSNSGAETGVDIEKVRDKILKIKHKFLSQKELQELEGASLQKYTLYWSAKEAIYKAHNTEGLLFAEEIFIEPFVLNETEGMIKASVNRAGSEKKYNLRYQILNEYVLVYIIGGDE